MLRLVFEVETDDVIGIKELIAMEIEKIGKVKCVEVTELDEQSGLWN